MKRAFLGIVRGGWLAVTILALWWILSRNSEEFFWPPLTNILQRFQEVWIFDRVGSDLWPSVRNLFVAILLSTAIAVPLGVLLGLWHKGYAVLSPFLSFIWALPRIALLPAFIAVVGIGASMQITYVVAGTLWPILLGTIDGVRAVDPTLKDVMRVYRVDRWTMIRSVLLPGAAPAWCWCWWARCSHPSTASAPSCCRPSRVCPSPTCGPAPSSSASWATPSTCSSRSSRSGSSAGTSPDGPCTHHERKERTLVLDIDP
jgi:hypothetical protein